MTLAGVIPPSHTPVSTMKHDLTILSASDIHLLNPNTPTYEIIQKLRSAFNKDTLRDVDILMLVGDIFDRRGVLDGGESHEVTLWIAQLLEACEVCDVELIVLEGTPSHDWKQSRWFDTVKEMSGSKANLNYIDTLSIHRSTQHGLSFLCVPDEWRPDTLTTQQEVVQLLAKEGLEKVDFALMHGQFPHQLPEHINSPKHDPDFYHSIVKHLIFIGHIHQYSVHDRIVAQGSFDRLTHNDEKPKGHVRVDFSGENYRIQQIVNEKAKVYHTIDCSGLTIEQSLEKISADCDYPDGSHMRIAALGDDPVLMGAKAVFDMYPQFKWTTKKTDAKPKKIKANSDLFKVEEVVSITKDNVAELLAKELEKRGVDPDTYRECMEILNGAT